MLHLNRCIKRLSYVLLSHSCMFEKFEIDLMTVISERTRKGYSQNHHSRILVPDLKASPSDEDEKEDEDAQIITLSKEHCPLP
jgi:hypothetical protein